MWYRSRWGDVVTIKESNKLPFTDTEKEIRYYPISIQRNIDTK